MVKLGGVPPVKADVTYPSRALGTIYQNTSGRPIVVIVSVNCLHAAATDDAYVEGDVAASSPPTAIAGYAGFMAYSGSSPDRAYFVLTFFVPNGYYYRAVATVSGTSAVGLARWSEIQL